MLVEDIRALELSEIKIIKYKRFEDHRGYFTENYRQSDFTKLCDSLNTFEVVQMNESFSHKGVVRGLHFQWNPFMGKLVRCLTGSMIDLVLDVRPESNTFGKAIGYEMIGQQNTSKDEWIWVPPGFAHGNIFLEDSLIQYLCTGEYSQNCEAGISPLATDIDWSLCSKSLYQKIQSCLSESKLITEKDLNGLSIQAWATDERRKNFTMEALEI